MATLTLVHLSALHFHALPGGLKEWASKRLLGALNWTLKRRRQYPLERYRRLLEAVRSRPWDHLLISGDLTQLALEGEFRQARA
ncbi:MAG: metallophosphoesterase, partial [bacterium]